MVLTTGPLDWESSALITRPLLHEEDGTEKTDRETRILKWRGGGGENRDQRVGDFKRGWLELPYELSLKHSLKNFFSSAFVN